MNCRYSTQGNYYCIRNFASTPASSSSSSSKAASTPAAASSSSAASKAASTPAAASSSSAASKAASTPAAASSSSAASKAASTPAAASSSSAASKAAQATAAQSTKSTPTTVSVTVDPKKGNVTTSVTQGQTRANFTNVYYNETPLYEGFSKPAAKQPQTCKPCKPRGTFSNVEYDNEHTPLYEGFAMKCRHGFNYVCNFNKRTKKETCKCVPNNDNW
jgi:hypothetical protein